MKRVVIITNLFHASPRIPGLCKYITAFGWEPVVLATPIGENPEARLGPPNDFAKRTRVIEIGYTDVIAKLKDAVGFKSTEGSRAQLERKFSGSQKSALRAILRRLLILAGAVIAYPDEMRWWRKPAIAAGLRLLQKEHFDAILTSSSPVTSHRIAHALKAKMNIPWVADFRDLWTQNHNYLYPKVRKIFETRLEQRTVSTADAFTTVSESLVEKLRSRYSGIPVTNIPNGFDPVNINEPPTPLTKQFTITYTGTIYTDKQDPKKILQALKELVTEKVIDPSTIAVRFYGTQQERLQEMIKESALEAIVTQHGHVARNDIYARQRESHVLLMFGWEDAYETGTFPIKLFEYMAARRPVLATGGTKEEAFRRTIEETKIGAHAIDILAIKKALTAFYNEYRVHGAVAYHGDSNAMDYYSHRAMARSFSRILDTIREKNQTNK